MVRTVKRSFMSVTVTLMLGFALPVCAQARHPLRDAAAGKITAPTIKVTAPSGRTVTKRLPFFSASTIQSMHDAMGTATIRGQAEPLNAPGSAPGLTSNLAIERTTVGCGERNPNGNVRVNQDCTFRRQAEEKLAFNPTEPTNLLAGMNDSRVGFNQTGIAFSVDNGEHWGDLLPPFRQKLNDPTADLPTESDPNRNTILGGPGTLHTYDVASDPAPAFDSSGRGFYGAVAFDIASPAAMLFVTQSPKGAQGSFFLNITGRSFVIVEDNNPNVSHDKPFITADAFTNSPNRDNVYATWTVFQFGCGPDGGFCASPIFGSMSTDHGMTWSTPEQISGKSNMLCFFGNFFDPGRSPHACDFDQGSDPAVLPNGDLVVIFNNGNTAENNPNAQQLGVSCHPTGSSSDGTAHLNCGEPAKVGDDILVGEPLCNFGRGPEECIPGPWIRTNDFPRIAVDPKSGNLFATWQDYRNGEFDIQLALSTNGGSTWAQSSTVNPDTGLDHYFPAVAVGNGEDETNRVGVSYYRSGRVPNENTTPSDGFSPGMPGVQEENSDYVLAGGKSLNTPFPFKVVSPVFPPPDGIQAGFNGDYSGLIINRGLEAHPLWSDTRNSDPFSPLNGVTHDEDVFTDKIELPQGTAHAHAGQLGSNSLR